jgi:iron(III) transport system permease protein
LLSDIKIKWKSSAKFWLGFATFFSILVLLPLLTIFISISQPVASGWEELFDNLISLYATNTAILAFGVSAFCLLFAVLPAWFIANYQFPFSKSLKWMMVLPLSIPTYIIAFLYGDIFSYGGEFYSIVYALFGVGIRDVYFDIFKIYYLIPILSSVLYPYIYLSALDSFENNNKTFIESAQLLGKSKPFIFRKIAIPLSRPAIASGLFLVNMELLNDYGAMDYFGVQTFTTGIFRTWFGMNDLGSSLRLALILFSITFLFIYAEKFFRRQAKFFEEGNHAPLSKAKLGTLGNILAISICALPLLLGFFVPIAKLVHNAISTYHIINPDEYLSAIGNTILLSLLSAVIITTVAIFMIYGERTAKFRSINKLISISTVGYAIPGAIIAVSMLFFLANIKDIFGIFLFGSFVILIYSYNIRFLATAYTPIKSATDKLGLNPYESSRLMGYGTIKSFFKADLPILRPAILTALLLTVVEILKELPLTLILRPFNFSTVSTLAYRYAKNEMVKDASIYSLSIIAISVLPIILFVKLKKQK